MASRSELLDLRRKYEELLRLRREATESPESDPRRKMAALAAEFPGALREVDELTLLELERRRAEVSATAEGTRPEAPWMHALIRLHALTRGALCAKRWLAGRRHVDGTTEAEFEAAAAAFCYAEDARAWRSDLARVAQPPKGRVTDLVFERLASELSLGELELRRLVLGDSRADGRKRVD